MMLQIFQYIKKLLREIKKWVHNVPKKIRSVTSLLEETVLIV